MNAVAAEWGRCLSCFLINVAAQAILRGKVELAEAAAAAGLPLAPADSPGRQRLLLYSGCASIVTSKFEFGLGSLRSVDEVKLGLEDRELLHASLALADKLRKTPMPLNQDGLAVVPKRNRVFPASGRQEIAKRALTRVDAILKNAK